MIKKLFKMADKEKCDEWLNFVLFISLYTQEFTFASFSFGSRYIIHMI